MSEWSSEGLNFDAKVHIKDLSKFGVQKIIDDSSSLDEETEEEDSDE